MSTPIILLEVDTIFIIPAIKAGFPHCLMVQSGLINSYPSSSAGSVQHDILPSPAKTQPLLLLWFHPTMAPSLQGWWTLRGPRTSSFTHSIMVSCPAKTSVISDILSPHWPFNPSAPLWSSILLSLLGSLIPHPPLWSVIPWLHLGPPFFWLSLGSPILPEPSLWLCSGPQSHWLSLSFLIGQLHLCPKISLIIILRLLINCCTVHWLK